MKTLSGVLKKLTFLGLLALCAIWLLKNPEKVLDASKPTWAKTMDLVTELDNILPWKVAKANAKGILFLRTSTGEVLWTQTVDLPEGLKLKEARFLSSPSGKTMLAIQGYIEVDSNMVENLCPLSQQKVDNTSEK